MPHRMSGLLAAFVVAGCAPEPLPLPAAAAVHAQLDRSLEPPLYRKLYDYAFLPEVQFAEQRVRLRIWLHYMDLDRYQLGLLDELAARTERERTQVEERQREIIEAREPAVKEVYDELWAALDRGANDVELATIGRRLDGVRDREADLLDLRARSVRTLFEAQATFLRTLAPGQDARFADAIFLLRHRLDPYANPGDFNALVGPAFVAGEFGTLSRTTFDPTEDHLNVAGLWSDKPTAIAGAHFPDARREVILYMVCLEPALRAAIAGELAKAPVEPVAGTVGAPVPGEPGAPVPESGALAPGVPEQPAPGVPEEPEPAPPGAPLTVSPGDPRSPG